MHGDLKVFFHHLYEYNKGLRNLVLQTLPLALKEEVEATLQKREIPFLSLPLNAERFNLFFGASDCITIVRNFTHESLSHLTAEEDFILGIMLGYDRQRQCARYLQRVAKNTLCIDRA